MTTTDEEVTPAESPVWVFIADQNSRLAPLCIEAGITSRQLLVTAATQSPWPFIAAMKTWRIEVPPSKAGAIPNGVVKAVFEPLVDSVRVRVGRLLARCGDGTDGAIVIDGELRVPWVDLGDLGER